jgi:hypothetical protein
MTSMVLVRFLTGLGTLVMAAAIVWGFATASSTDRGGSGAPQAGVGAGHPDQLGALGSVLNPRR